MVFTRTSIWGFLASVLVLALALSGSMLSRAAAEPPADLAPAYGATAKGAAAAAAGSVASWRSNGPYGGNVQALALSPAFNTDGLAFAGGWRGDGSTGGYGIMCTIDGGASGQPWGAKGTTDRGDSWTKAIADNVVLAVAFSRDFGANQTVYAAVTEGTAATSVLRSTDAGVTWSPAWSATSLNFYDLLETAEGSLLLATPDGVKQLIRSGGSFAEVVVTTNIPATVNRLVTGGDNIYAVLINRFRRATLPDFDNREHWDQSPPCI